MTLCIASFFCRNLPQLTRLAEAAWGLGADAAELRIDQFDAAPGELAAFLRDQPNRRWIIACRTIAEGGSFSGSQVDAARLVLAASAGTHAWVDLAVDAWKADSAVRIQVKSHLEQAGSAKVILSLHNLSGNPANVDESVQEILRCGEAFVAKIAYDVDHIIDSFPVLDLMQRWRTRMVAICMGEAGSWTRILAKKFCAFGTYTSLASSRPTAPGQLSIQDLRQLGWDRLTPGTSIYAVAGDPVAHSLGPSLFNHCFAQFGLNAVYVPLKISPDRGGLGAFLDECRRRPWLGLAGLSVTIPHKTSALEWAGDGADPMSRAIGAANTLVLGESGPAAYNTDCYAAVDSLAAALTRRRDQLAGLKVDVLGTGGAARAVCYGLLELGCHVSVYARNPAEAVWFHGQGINVFDWELRTKCTGNVLINCTPIGMWPHVQESPLTREFLRGKCLVFDLVYRPMPSRLLREAIEAGCPVLGGLDMFVRQAATQFALWFGRSPDTNDGLKFLRDLLAREAREARRSVALIGARGSGKSTVAAILATLLELPHIDTDDLVIRWTGKSLAELFRTLGEAGFRKAEREAVDQAALSIPAVISLGGGAILDRHNVDVIREVATIVWLTAPPHILADRIACDPATVSQRPALTGEATTEMDRIVTERSPLYRQAADLVIDTESVSPDEVARRIVQWLTESQGRE